MTLGGFRTSHPMNLLTLDSIRHLWLVDGACDGENSDTNDAPPLSFASSFGGAGRMVPIIMWRSVGASLFDIHVTYDEFIFAKKGVRDRISGPDNWCAAEWR